MTKAEVLAEIERIKAKLIKTREDKKALETLRLTLRVKEKIEVMDVRW